MNLYQTALQLTQRQSRFFSALSCECMYLIGRSAVPIHPKHLYDKAAVWYARFLRPHTTFVDIGCGVGSACFEAERCGCAAYGLDLNQKNLSIANTRKVELKSSAQFSQADFETGLLPIESGFADVVLFADVMEHINNRIPVLKEIGRILKDDGLLLISVPNRDTSWKRRLQRAGLFSYDDDDHKIEYTIEILTAELRQGGFQIDGAPETIVLSTPLAGLIDMTAIISPAVYRRLARWKRDAASHNPGNSIGWRVAARKIKVA